MHTVIIGGGFAGIKAALELANKQTGKITLISNSPYFNCHASLYSILAGKSKRQSKVTLSDIFAHINGVDIVQDEVISINPEKNIVRSKDVAYEYDKLILSPGMVPDNLGISGVKSHTLSIRNLEDIDKLRKRLEANTKEKIAIIGAGPAGVEFAGALSEWYEAIDEVADITLIDSGNRVLPTFSKTASRLASRKLRDMGIKIQLKRSVQEVKSSHIVLNNGVIPAKNIIWAAGEILSPIITKHVQYFGIEENRVQVDDFLEAYKDIYVIGDCAKASGSGTADGAIYMAEYVAKHIIHTMMGRKSRPYHHKPDIKSVPIGSNWAYVEQSGIYVSGKLGSLTRSEIEHRLYRQIMPRVQAFSALNPHS